MMASGIEDLMLPCANKALFGIECPGCGLQRATALFFKGEFAAAFHMYPAIYSLLLLGAFLLVNIFVKFRFAYQIKIGLLLLNVLVIIVSYLVKISPYL